MEFKSKRSSPMGIKFQPIQTMKFTNFLFKEGSETKFKFSNKLFFFFINLIKIKLKQLYIKIKYKED